MTTILRSIGVALALATFALLAYAGYAAFSSNAVTAGAIGGPFSLTDQNGRTVTDRDLRGKWLVIYFGYTHCPDACPTALNNIADALQALGSKRARVTPIFITVDPARDTPAVMKSYVQNFGSGFVGLSGSGAAVTAVEQAYRVYATKHVNADGSYDMDHSSIIYIMDPNGHFVTNFTDETDPGAIAGRLKALID
jgi:protein SCO1/2